MVVGRSRVGWGWVWLWLVLFVAAVGCSERSSADDSGLLAIVDGVLIDGTGAEPVADAVILIDGDRIVAVGTSADVEVPQGVRAIDVDGAAVLPGFVNAHVHAGYSEDRLRSWALAGVTTVRDLGAGIVDVDDPSRVCFGICGSPAELYEFRDRINSDPAFARLVAVGPFVSAPREASMNLPPGLEVTDPNAARPVIGPLVDDGADLIKLYVNEPASESATAQDTISAVVDASHDGGLPVTAHVLRRVHVQYALNAGVDDLAHMPIERLTDDLIAQAIDQGTYWVPTLELWHCLGSNVSNTVENLRRVVEAGGSIALGTDYAGAPPPCRGMELGMPTTEIGLMSRAGMSPMEIIVAATRNAAHVCGLDHEIGTLEEGKIADVLIVTGNPLDDLGALTNTHTVIHNGVVIRDQGSTPDQSVGTEAPVELIWDGTTATYRGPAALSAGTQTFRLTNEDNRSVTFLAGRHVQDANKTLADAQAWADENTNPPPRVVDINYIARAMPPGTQEATVDLWIVGATYQLDIWDGTKGHPAALITITVP